MEIKVNSKFELGTFRKIKGSANQKLLICEIITGTCGTGTQIFYKGALYTKKDSFGLRAKSWQGEIEQNLPEEWTLDKGMERIDELLLE